MVFSDGRQTSVCERSLGAVELGVEELAGRVQGISIQDKKTNSNLKMLPTTEDRVDSRGVV